MEQMEIEVQTLITTMAKDQIGEAIDADNLDMSLNPPSSKSNLKEAEANLDTAWTCVLGKLQLETTPTFIEIAGRAKVVHSLRLLAGEPWPRRSFEVNLEVTVDRKDLSVEKICSGALPSEVTCCSTTEASLCEWMWQRLTVSHQHPEKVLGVLVWTANKWFTAAIHRASTLYELAVRPTRPRGTVWEYEAVPLAPYLHQSQLRIPVFHSVENCPGTEILLTWTIEIDSTGDPSTKLSIALPSGPCPMEEKLKGHFNGSFEKRGVAFAINSVLAILQQRVD